MLSTRGMPISPRVAAFSVSRRYPNTRLYFHSYMFGIGDFFGTRSKDEPRSQRLPETWRSPFEKFVIVI